MRLRARTRAGTRRTPVFAVAAALAGAGTAVLAAPTAAAAPAAISLPATFDSEVGCSVDWQPACPQAQLSQRADGRWAATLNLPAGSFEYKIAVDNAWSENYGVGGARDGADIPITVPSGGRAVTFVYDPATHVVSDDVSAVPGSLGALYTPTATTFRIWSPDSSDVKVTVGGTTYPLGPTSLSGYSAVHQVTVGGDLKGQAYQFGIGGTAVRDPYARMVRSGTTQGVVVDSGAIAPTGGTWAPRPALANREDSVVYELSVRDFTVDASSGVDAAKRGKFLGLVQTGTTKGGARTGIDHLKELGVTAVQLMPAFDFGSTTPNWGYDPVDHNVPEEQYSQFTAPEDRIREFKDMVDGFHRNGLRVVMDVVFNHTYDKNVFGGITGAYYTPADLSGTGNSIDDGNPMVSRMIQDSLEHWVRDYNVDGFRFDLLGVHHWSSVSTWATYLTSTYPDRNLLLYGEPWNGAVADPQEAQKVRYGTVPALAAGHVGVFNGVYRDAIRGGTDTDVMAYMGGTGNAGAIAFGMRGSPTDARSTATIADLWTPAFAHDPEQTVNYASIHDNLNLYDKITYSGATGGATGTAGRIDRFAAGMILTSQGIPVIAEGDEFLRSKVVGGDYTTAKNSYNAPDTVNAIHWGDKTTNAAVFRYYKDAIALRRSTPALRLTTWDAVHDRMTAQTDGPVVVARLGADPATPTGYDTVVVANPTSAPYDVTLPAGTWTKVLDTDGATSAGDTACTGLAVTVFRRN
ncbi:type I pullulanase [Kitasatospora sp. NE20-6]|uniref:pullulanase X25 domain-containing protein n=1 Tax=Kitasatospora sp. NE20-6 TaxID=2859066 RepID=UPI0034DC4F52